MFKTGKLILALGAVALFAAGQAQAQPGSRVCGWAAITPQGNFALAYESRQKDASDGKQCEAFIEKIAVQLLSNPNMAKLKPLPWQIVKHETKCEDLGKHFVDDGKYKSNDMCDNMEAKGHGYMVTTTPQPGGKRITSYNKL